MEPFVHRQSALGESVLLVPLFPADPADDQRRFSQIYAARSAGALDKVRRNDEKKAILQYTSSALLQRIIAYLCILIFKSV